MATVIFTYSYSLSGGRGQHLLLRMSRTALHIGDCLAALLRTCSPGHPSCGPPGRASPESQSARFAWDAYGCLGSYALSFNPDGGEWTLCRALMPPSSFPATL